MLQRERIVAGMPAMLVTSPGSLGAVTASMAQWRAAAEDAQRSSARAAGALSFYEDLLAAAHPYRTGEAVTLHDLLERADHRLTVEHVSPDAEASIRLALAEAHANLMQWPDAARHATRAAALFRGSASADGATADPAGLASALTVQVA